MKRIIISRTDSIGDVILTLPVAAVLKKHFPGCKICFLGKSYTRPVIEACEYVDEFIDIQHLKSINADAILHIFPVKEICIAAKKAGIPLRIATSHRWYTWLYCNKLLHFSRNNSDLHEAQLNLKMLEGLGIRQEYPLTEIPKYYGLKVPITSPSSPPSPHSPHSPQFQLILHPKSKGSAREWGLENFCRLIELLPVDKFRIIVTGTKEEGNLMKDFLDSHRERITDMTGKLTLPELISFIDSCDGLVAASTGPLHIAAALGKHAIGIYAPMKPIHPGRWAPVGINSTYLCLDKKCDECRHSMDCECIRSIRPEDVAHKLEAALSTLS